MGLVYLRQGEPNDIVRHNYTPFDDDDHRERVNNCLLYTSDAADDLLCVDLGGRRIIKKKKYTEKHMHCHHSNTPVRTTCKNRA